MPELDLHRMTIDKALPRIDDFLYETYRAGLHHVRIVHGKGTGVLRQGVIRYLSSHPLVKSFHSADKWGGGVGATEVELV